MRRLLSIMLSLAMITGMLFYVPVIADETTTPQTYNDRIETLFNNDWQFWRESSRSTNTTYQNFAAKDVEFENINLPHDFSIETPFSTVNTTNRSGCLQGGTGWYKKTFTMPSELKDKRIVINFDGVYSYSYVYVNGTQVGSNIMGYVAFAFDITDYLNFGFDKTNEIVVKVINAVPSERWYSGSGIYRDVTIIITDPVHVDYRGTAISMPNLASTSGADGILSSEVTVKNDSAVDTSAVVKTTIEKDGAAVGTAAQSEVTVAAGSKSEVTLAPKVENPELWSVKTPNLYNLKTEVIVDGKVVDTYDTTFGYKYLEFSSESGFFLNGESMKLKGVGLHNDLGSSIGTKAYDTAVKRYIDLVKDMGCNAIRTAHQPLSQNLMNYCAEVGIMVCDEIFDEWLHSKINDTGSYNGYFAQGIAEENNLLLKDEMGKSDVSGWSTAATPTWSEFGLKSTIMRDRNNPAVIIWSLGNELFEANNVSAGTNKTKYPKIGKSLNEWVDEVDPQMHPTCFGDNRNEAGQTGSTREYLDQVQATMDITGLNYGVAWGADDQLKTLFPNKPVFNTEATDECSERGVYDKTKLYKGNGPEDYQFSSYNNDDRGWAEYGYESWNLIIKKDWFMGQFLWAGIDYLGEPCDYTQRSGLQYPNTTYCGSYDSCGFPKDTMYLFRSIWNDNAHTSNMLPGTWNKNEVAIDSNGYVPVHVYSNADKVEILLNGKVVARGTSEVESTSSTERTNFTQRVWTATAVDTSVCNTTKVVSDTKISGQTNDFTKNYLQFRVKYSEGTLELKSYSKNEDGTYTEITDAKGTQSVTTNNGIEKLNVKQSATEITADSDSIVYYELTAQTADGKFVNGYNGRVKLTINGEGELIGTDNGNSRSVVKGASYKSVSADKKTAVVDVYNGKALAVTRSTGEIGNFTVTAAAYSGNDETDNSALVDTVTTNEVTVTADTVADEFEEQIEQHTHVYNTEGSKVVTAPTCTEQGYTTYTCDICNAVTKGDYTPDVGHTVAEDGSCSVCGLTAQQISVVDAGAYAEENKIAGGYKYTSLSKDEINSKTPYALIGTYDANIRIITNEIVRYAPNNYYDGNGLRAYNVGEIPIENQSGDHIYEFDFHDNLSQFLFDYDETAGTLVIATIVEGAKKYLAHYKTGTSFYISLKWVDSVKGATVFNANYNEATHRFTDVYTDYNGTKFYLGTRFSGYQVANYVFMLSTMDKSGFEVFSVEKTVPSSYQNLCSALITAGARAKTDASYASAQAENVEAALALYKQGITANEAECITYSSALTSPIHTCSYSSNGTITKVPTCGEEGQISYECTFEGCPNTRVETISKTDEHEYNENHLCSICGANEPVRVTINETTTVYDYGTEFVFPEFENDGDVAYKDAKGNYYIPGDTYGALTADVSFTSENLSFSMLSGASIRINAQTGIRFYSAVNTDLIDTLREKGITIELGTLIAPVDKIGNKNFTKEIGIAGTDYVDVKYTSKKWFDRDGFKGFVGSIVNIKRNNLNRNFVGRGYITVKYGNTDKTIYADYYDSSIENNSRSICYISNKIIISGDYGTLPSLHQEIVKNFADQYTGFDKYTNIDPDGNDDFE